MSVVLVGVCLMGMVCPSRLAAQSDDLILEIRIEGASQVERGQVVSGLRSRTGEPLDAQKITSDIKDIFRLGYFKDVRAEMEQVPGRGIILIFRLTEKPRISTIEIVGNTQVTKSKLKDTLTIKVGNIYAKRLVDSNLELIREEYRKEGFFKARVSSRIERHSEQSYGLTLIIEERPRLYITDIRTHNNEILSELEIRRMMSSAEVDCFSWITDSGVFDEQRINQDLQTISSKYLENGYIRLFIDKPKVKLVHNREFSRIRVDLTLTEGAQYFTGSVDVAGDILGKKGDLLDRLQLKKGAVYNPFTQRRDRFRLNEFYQEQGYAFVRVVPDVKIDDETKLVDVVYRITKGDKAYIGRIEFQGNRETRDFVMRREFEVRENELYNGRNLRVSQQNLNRLGYFKPGIGITRRPTEVDNVLDIVTKVDETQTGTLQAQLAFSDQTGAVVSVSVSKGNLFGRGQTIRLSASVGQRNVTRAFNFDFIEPHVFGSDISSDSSLSLTTRDDFSGLSRGSIDETRVSQGFGFPIIPLLRFNISFSVVKREFAGRVSEPTSLRSVTPSLRYNSVDNPIFPSSGTNTLLAVQQVGGRILGGDTEYRRYRFRTRRFFSLNEKNTLVLMGRVRLSWLEQVGDNLIPLEDRFRLGGISTLRGYEFSEIGGPFGNLERALNSVDVQAFDESGQPIFDQNGRPVLIPVDRRTIGFSDDQLRELRSGGTSERLFNLELLFPLAGDNVRGLLFYDAGNVNVEDRQYELLGEPKPDFFDLKQSYGAGVRLITPLGVFRFEYGRKLRAEKGEAVDKFDFTISSLF
jgi:outer membrane protein insertion porin family